MKLLIVNNDQASAGQLSKTLSKHYCVIDVAADGQTALAMIQQWDYDAVLLNFKSPGQDSIHFCRQMRQQGCNIPVLMLIPHADTNAAVTSLEAGADDCVPESTETRLLLARLKALRRRQTQEFSNSLLSWGPLKLDMNQFRVSYHDDPIYLSSREYRLLELFLQNPKRVFTRDAILDRLWPIDDPPSTATVTNLVKDLRRKLKDVGVVGQPIRTVHGIGYQLSPPPLTIEEPAIFIKDETCRAESQPFVDHPLVQAFQQQLQEYLTRISDLALALQRDALTLELQQQVRAVAHTFAVMLDSLGYSQASNTLRTIDYCLASSLPFPSAKTKHLQELLCQLQQHLAQPPSQYDLVALPFNLGLEMQEMV
jgi:DNA-binding response OmpR family regulator/HPt (histidine-containing phosphotransfer) domain-containing protein